MAWWTPTSKYEKMTDYEAGIEALKEFYKVAQTYPISYTFDQLVQKIESVYGGKGQIAGLGLGIKVGGSSYMNMLSTEPETMTDSAVASAMKELAQATEGHIPAEVKLFREALTNEAKGLILNSGFLDNQITQSILGSSIVSDYMTPFANMNRSVGNVIVDVPVAIYTEVKDVAVAVKKVAAATGEAYASYGKYAIPVAIFAVAAISLAIFGTQVSGAVKVTKGVFGVK